MTQSINASQPEASKSSVPLALQIQASGGMSANLHNPKAVFVKDYGNFAILRFTDVGANMEVTIFFPDIDSLATAIDIIEKEILRILGGE